MPERPDFLGSQSDPIGRVVAFDSIGGVGRGDGEPRITESVDTSVIVKAHQAAESGPAQGWAESSAVNRSVVLAHWSFSVDAVLAESKAEGDVMVGTSAISPIPASFDWIEIQSAQIADREDGAGAVAEANDDSQRPDDAPPEFVGPDGTTHPAIVNPDGSYTDPDSNITIDPSTHSATDSDGNTLVQPNSQTPESNSDQDTQPGNAEQQEQGVPGDSQGQTESQDTQQGDTAPGASSRGILVPERTMQVRVRVLRGQQGGTIIQAV